MKKILFTLFIIATIIGGFTPLNAQEIIEYDYVCTRFEDDTELEFEHEKRVRIRYEGTNAYVNVSHDGKTWNQRKDGEYNWLKYTYDYMEDDKAIFYSYSQDLEASLGFNECLIIFDDRETIIMTTLYTDNFKRAYKKKEGENLIGFAEEFKRSKDSSKKPSWMK